MVTGRGPGDAGPEYSAYTGAGAPIDHSFSRLTVIHSISHIVTGIVPLKGRGFSRAVQAELNGL